MRNAAHGGSVASLWPVGVSTVEELPQDLALSIQHCQRVCSWQENLTSDEIPPHWMWHLDHEIKEWFEQVEADREAKYNSGGGVDSGGEQVDNQMMSNDLAGEMRARRG